MDPWISQDKEELEVSGLNNLETSDSLHNSTTTSSQSAPDKSVSTLPFFEDNFQPQSEQPFSKLPDSQEYIASLGTLIT